MKQQNKIEWKEVELGEVSQIVSGSTPSTIKSEYWEGGIINWITPAEIGNGNNGYYYETRKKITKKGLESASINLFPKGTVMLTSRAPIGKVAIAGTEMCSNQEFKNFICKKDQLVSEYLYYWLRSKENYLNSIGRGATFKEISKFIVSKLKIPIPFSNEKPDIKEQERIVKILEKAEKLKERGKKTSNLFDEYLKSVFNEMFLKDSFDLVEIGKVAPLQGGFAFKSKDYTNDGIKLVKITNVWNNILIWEDKTFLPNKYLEKYRSFSLKAGDIVLSMTRPIIKSLGSVKIVQIREHDLPCLLNQRVGRFLIDKNKVLANYLLHYCYTSEFKREVDKYCSTSLQPNISSNQINSIKISLPPLPLQQKFAKIVEQVEKLKENVKKVSKNSEKLFNSLMHKAFRGELVR
ncbi:MAG: restriction endonuclease subunit S [Nanoarchaeota archaeon]